ncbi:SDR family NAD(P)-dependent oxidoreductase [Mucilaginibacter sp. Bleaf8]|uniref:SDR family NAD(P)-dependent oxidoreductase n=1 Tax=Mucilaginibacter sp. Bleaf8 TaxID=2834430 RepID=UPI001BCBE433|nr:SDR family NAD(P)-dependent oxidoreductase [Mucilaginibacter sp. Bleaf8]MBS7562906.1 SDR family NAD(P)-dependent oxidoreductase [Mucilaginibacter sp. Bleaf8]
MKNTILVAGATGNLGEKICRELIKRGATVRAIVRNESEPAKVEALQKLGVSIIKANFADASHLEATCSDISCVVSALAGLHDVIVTAQSQLLNAAVQAGVPRFIPSDFCTDYTQLSEGDNRNFDLRKTFKNLVDNSAIKPTSIFNGAFSYVLQYGIPLFNPKDHTIAYYEGKQDWKIDFTTLDDTAAFTAAAALDDETPRYLRIASFQVSPHDLASLSQQLYGEAFRLVNSGTMEQFSAYNQKLRAENPEGEKELYPRWQQAQYLYSMFAAHHTGLDNNRYPDLSWSSANEALQQI